MKRICPACSAVRSSISQTTCPRCGEPTLRLGRAIIRKGGVRIAAAVPRPEKEHRHG